MSREGDGSRSLLPPKTGDDVAFRYVGLRRKDP